MASFSKDQLKKTNSLESAKSALSGSGYSKNEVGLISDVYKSCANFYQKRTGKNLFGNGLYGIVSTNEKIQKSDFQPIEESQLVHYETFIGDVDFEDVGLYIRGATQTISGDRGVMYLTGDKNITTPIHELAHVIEKFLSSKERSQIQAWAKSQGMENSSECFAQGFEKYILESKEIDPELKSKFNNIYPTKMSNLTLNDEVRSIYSKMINGK